MTTKIKIIVGFVVMVGLLAIVATIGYFSTTKLGDGFAEYRQLSRSNVGVSDAVAEINYAVERLDAIEKEISALSSVLTSFEERRLLEPLKASMQELKDNFTTFKDKAEDTQKSIDLMARFH